MMKLASLFSAALALAAVGAARADGGPVRAVAPLPGYTCMTLALTPAQMRDSAVVVPILGSPGGPQVAGAAALVIVRQPSHIVRGYAEVMRLNGKPGWIARDKLRPVRGNCTPAMMSNGRPGFGP